MGALRCYGCPNCDVSPLLHLETSRNKYGPCTQIDEQNTGENRSPHNQHWRVDRRLLSVFYHHGE